jgi:outer membrane lipoprotein-sorting protein
MSLRRSLVSVLSLLVALAHAPARIPAQTSPAVDGTAFVARANAAMGCSLVGKDTTIMVTGSVKAGSLPNRMRVIIQSQGNTRWRSELDTPKEHKVTVINEGKGQMQHADGRVTPLAQYNTFHQRPMHIPCLTNIALLADALVATYLRTETTSSDLLDVIELLPTNRPTVMQLADRMKTTVWISRSTGYLAKMQYMNASETDFNDTQTVEISYSDYRVVDGLAVPFHQVNRDGEFTLDLLIDSVQLNGPAADFSLR